MTLPPAVPAEPKRGIPRIPFRPAEGDRVEKKFAFALASALSRAPERGRQQVTRRGVIPGLTFWLIQDVR